MSAKLDVTPKGTLGAVIRVIGVGGGGCNAVDNMVASSLKGVEFISANTDLQALQKNKAKWQLQLGAGLTNGLGAGSDPEIGRNAALESREMIVEALRGADMVFVTAGMGGGTGTGAAPIVAEIAKSLGILTVAVVTRPFLYEGKRCKVADAGLDELKKWVDSLIIIPNEKLMETLAEELTQKEAFLIADEVLRRAVAGIAEVITCPGLINVDFADIKAVMSQMGMAMMGSAESSGVDRARLAVEEAIHNPLLDNVTLNGAKGVLVNISTAPNQLKMREYREIMSMIAQYVDDEAQIKFGTAEIVEMADEAIRVTIIATGLGKKVTRNECPEYIRVIKTGTDDQPLATMDYGNLDMPAVMRQGRRSLSSTTPSSTDSVPEQFDASYDIPAFLRKQAD
ncbi:MAG: cell division protein FtsZ [Neisseriales bacterium]|nr:MAG: cell division protein FtsZ [Neisseriales bacterium]